MKSRKSFQGYEIQETQNSKIYVERKYVKSDRRTNTIMRATHKSHGIITLEYLKAEDTGDYVIKIKQRDANVYINLNNLRDLMDVLATEPEIAALMTDLNEDLISSGSEELVGESCRRGDCADTQRAERCLRVL